LWQVTQFRLQDYRRRRGRQPQATGGSSAQEQLARLPDELPSQDGSAPATDNDEVLLSALELVRGDFESHTWEAFWLVTVDGWAAGDAATRLEMSRGAVYVAKSRVLKRLREELDGVIDFGNISSRWRDVPGRNE
jgi:RNA polymerase sigma-70 factor (ECF subfamily)